MTRRKPVATLILLSALQGTSAHAQDQSLTRTIREYAQTHGFNGTMLVQRGGKTP